MTNYCRNCGKEKCDDDRDKDRCNCTPKDPSGDQCATCGKEKCNVPFLPGTTHKHGENFNESCHGHQNEAEGWREQFEKDCPDDGITRFAELYGAVLNYEQVDFLRSELTLAHAKGREEGLRESLATIRNMKTENCGSDGRPCNQKLNRRISPCDYHMDGYNDKSEIIAAISNLINAKRDQEG